MTRDLYEYSYVDVPADRHPAFVGYHQVIDNPGLHHITLNVDTPAKVRWLDKEQVLQLWNGSVWETVLSLEDIERLARRVKEEEPHELDRFRDVIMEVEGIEPEYEEVTEPQAPPPQFDIPDDISELLERIAEAQREGSPPLGSPEYGPVWIAPQTHTVPPEPTPGQPHITWGDDPNTGVIYGQSSDRITISSTGARHWPSQSQTPEE